MSTPPEQDPLNPEAPLADEGAHFTLPAMDFGELDESLLVLPLGVFERPRPIGADEDPDKFSPMLEGEDFIGLSPVAKTPAPHPTSPIAPAAAIVVAQELASPVPGPESLVPAFAAQEITLSGEPQPPERLLFQSWYPPEVSSRRIPNLGDVLVLALVASMGWLGSGALTASALHYNLFGVSTVERAEVDVHYTLISMTSLYLIALLAGLLIFPLLWHKSMFAGLQWNAATAVRLRNRMFLAALVCFVLAMIDSLLLPGPSNAPIDKLFQTQQAAWMLFAFGVTFAPFFEEIVFRGFLLPALSTAFDWTAERFSGSQPRPLDENGQPRWSVPSMVIASIAVSIPFAYMHADQTGHAIGPFILLVCVSMVLCWARLRTRSLAASVMVHSSYNFLLFSLMLLGTGGFQHLDKM